MHQATENIQNLYPVFTPRPVPLWMALTLVSNNLPITNKELTPKSKW